MRLFIAMNLDDKTKQAILSVQDRLKACAVRGSFSCPENLHLTVVFLGEVSTDQAPIRSAMDRCFTEPFALTFNGTGTFRGNLHWIGIETNPELYRLYNELCRALSKAGYKVDRKDPFSPHITLAREVELSSKPDLTFERFSMPVHRLSLMKSERIGGRLVYTEVYGVEMR